MNLASLQVFNLQQVYKYRVDKNGLGLVRYAWVKTPDIALSRTELNLRSVNFDLRTKITALRKLILEDEGVRHKHQYDLTRKSFKPMDISIYQELLAV